MSLPSSLSPRLLLAGVVSVAVLGVGAVGVSAAAAGDGIPAGTRVAGVEVGGLSRAQATERLTQGLADRVAAPVPLRAAGQRLALPAGAGLALDAEASAREAASAGALGRLRARLGGGREVEPVVDVDEPALRAAVAALAAEVDREPREGSVRFEGVEPVPVQPLEGRTLDVDGAVDAVREGWLDERPVELPVAVDPVGTTEQEVARAVREIAEPAVAAPVTVEAGGDELTVPPAAVAAALTVQPDAEGRLVPRLDADVLRRQVEQGLADVGEPAVDATFDVSTGDPVVVPSATGRTVSARDLAAAVQEVLTEAAPRRASAPLTDAEPRLTTQEARGLGVREVIGSYTSEHPCCAPRVQNIQRIADVVDGHVLLPGERFDLNAVVGPRDRARGFVEAPQILAGEFVDRVGGGVSQFATALFNAVFFSGLEDVTHTPHSYYLDRYPPGREATISFPEPDLVFRNDSPHGVLVDTSYTDTSITVTFWGTRRYDEIRSETGSRTRLRDFETRYVERDDCTQTAGGQGFDITVTRVFVQDGQVVRREPFATRYKPEPRFVCGPPPQG